MSYSYKPVEWLEGFYSSKGLDLSSVLFNNVDTVLAAMPHPYTDKSGKPLTLTFNSVLKLSEDDIADLWIDRYDEYLVYKPVDESNAEALAKKLNKKALTTIKLNGPKYQAMLYSLAASYNPIENYAMVERGSDSVSEGKLTDKLTMSGNETNGTTGSEDLAVNGTDLTTNTGKGSILNTTWTSDVPYDNAAIMNGGGTSTGSNTGSTPLTSKTITQQSPTSDYSQDSNSTSTQSQDKNYNSTSTKSFNNRVDLREISHDNSTSANLSINNEAKLSGDNVNDHLFTRTGNIGVTTSQQMLESEIELKRNNIINEFFKDFNVQVLLSVLNAGRTFGIDTSCFVGDYVTKAEFSAAIAALNKRIDDIVVEGSVTHEEFETEKTRVNGKFTDLQNDIDGVDVEVQTVSDEVAEANTKIAKNATDIVATNKRIDDIEPGGGGVTEEEFKAEQTRVNGEFSGVKDRLDAAEIKEAQLDSSLQSKANKSDVDTAINSIFGFIGVTDLNNLYDTIKANSNKKILHLSFSNDITVSGYTIPKYSRGFTFGNPSGDKGLFIKGFNDYIYIFYFEPTKSAATAFRNPTVVKSYSTEIAAIQSSIQTLQGGVDSAVNSANEALNRSAINSSTLDYVSRNKAQLASIAATKVGINQEFQADGKFVASGINTSAYTQDLVVRDSFPTGTALKIRGADSLVRCVYQYVAITDTGETVYRAIGTEGVTIPANWTLRYVYVQRNATGGDGLSCEVYPVIQNADILDETYTPYQPTIDERLKALEAQLSS